MKAFRVTGWVQYKTDAATFINRVQIAKSSKEALETVKTQYGSLYRTLLCAAEVLAD